ncbi:MAG: hypothetical protein ACRDVE_13160, partial [Actinocrinis sp.]
RGEKQSLLPKVPVQKAAAVQKAIAARVKPDKALKAVRDTVADSSLKSLWKRPPKSESTQRGTAKAELTQSEISKAELSKAETATSTLAAAAGVISPTPDSASAAKAVAPTTEPIESPKPVEAPGGAAKSAPAKRAPAKKPKGARPVPAVDAPTMSIPKVITPGADAPTISIPRVPEPVTETIAKVRVPVPRRHYFRELRRARDHGLSLFEQAADDQEWEYDDES